MISVAMMLLLSAVAAAPAARHDPIPAFARKYRTTCSTCHTAAPKLNVLGEAFRLNGYRFPENDRLLRKEEAVPLGEDPWKDLWPRAIWPGEIPGTAPISLGVQSDIEWLDRAGVDPVLNLRFPNEVRLLAASTLGDGLAAFVEVEWSQEEGVGVEQAKLKFQGLLPWLGERAANLWVGLQSLYLFTFAERQIDRAARQSFRWQRFAPADLPMTDALTGAIVAGSGAARLGQPRPTVELNGVAGGRLFYAGGVAQGASDAVTDENRHKDLFYKLRYKVGGLSLAGQYADRSEPVVGQGGQLRDRSFTLEHFGYFGEEPAGAGAGDRYRAFGVAGRLLLGPLDAGAGYVGGSHANAWGLGTNRLRWSSSFAKAEYVALPWVMASVKLERFEVRYPADLAVRSLTAPPAGETHVLPGVILLIRQNVRGVVEGDLRADSRTDKPAALWLRLDVTF